MRTPKTLLAAAAKSLAAPFACLALALAMSLAAPEAAAVDPPPTTPAICFVIDTNQSMGPYVDASMNLVREFTDSVLPGGNADNAWLAFVAFRTPPVSAPLTEYGARIVSGFSNASDRAAIEAAVASMEEAERSTQSFNGDSIAGVNESLKLDWDRYGGGLIIVVTDAGPLPRGDRRSSTGDAPGSVRDKAVARKVRIATIHIKTAAGDGNRDDDNDRAREAYENMASSLGGWNAYIPIEIPSTEACTEIFAEVATTLIQAYHGRSRNHGMEYLPDPPMPPRPGAMPLERSRPLGELLGHPVRLDGLGARNNAN
jgi:hypothetical protein